MKAKLFTLILGLFCFIVYSQTSVPDLNFENYLETHDASGNVVDVGDSSSMGDGTNGNGFVTTASIENVTILNVASQGISSLEGIQDFTALERLTCNQNSLTSLNLSSNMFLERLFCFFNPGLTDLMLPNTPTLTNLEFYNCNVSGLDLTPYINLNFLRSYNNPSLGSIDVTKASNLEYLYCYNNGLNALDVTQNPNLRILDCYDNNLTELNVTQNPSLTRLWCHQNNLTGIDVTQNTQLTSFYCHLNDIENLDVSQNNQLDRLWCYSNQLNSLTLPTTNTLRNFRCYTNNLSTLDVSGLTGLEYFDCGINAITSLDVSMIPTLTDLYCNSNQLTYLNLNNFANGILNYMWANDNTSLTCIQVDNVASADSKTSVGDWKKDSEASYNTSCTLDIEDFNEFKMALFPNPSNNLFNVVIDLDAKFELFNIKGQEVENGELFSGTNQLNLDGLNNGIYFLKVMTTETVQTEKFIKR
ncbi:leucine-rich repeat domain-containing protein [Tamlana flava]|uniref:leucine-rich repeat domain-containing protein n=1 Tax=Tamlana flava TaxID=3158572 RepID=UPI00351BDA1E